MRVIQIAAATAAVIWFGRSGAMGTEGMPRIPTAVGMISDNLSQGVIHGWQSNHLLKHQGVL